MATARNPNPIYSPAISGSSPMIAGTRATYQVVAYQNDLTGGHSQSDLTGGHMGVPLPQIHLKPYQFLSSSSSSENNLISFLSRDKVKVNKTKVKACKAEKRTKEKDATTEILIEVPRQSDERDRTTRRCSKNKTAYDISLDKENGQSSDENSQSSRYRKRESRKNRSSQRTRSTSESRERFETFKKGCDKTIKKVSEQLEESEYQLDVYENLQVSNLSERTRKSVHKKLKDEIKTLEKMQEKLTNVDEIAQNNNVQYWDYFLRSNGVDLIIKVTKCVSAFKVIVRELLS